MRPCPIGCGREYDRNCALQCGNAPPRIVFNVRPMYIKQLAARVPSNLIYCAPDCVHDLPFPHMVLNEYLFCKLCGHWIDRPTPECRCRAGCHLEARSRSIVRRL
jgi:hypothetical protein